MSLPPSYQSFPPPYQVPESMPEAGRARPSQAGLMLLAGVVFVGSLVALVVLELSGAPTANLMALVGPVVAGLLLGGHISNLTAGQNKAIELIRYQTNGELTRRIREEGKQATLEALQAAGIAKTVPTITPVTGPDEAASDSTMPGGPPPWAVADPGPS